MDDLGIAGVVGAFLLIQLQILLDCSDGEVARWQGRFSAKGIYLDRIGHYVTEAALPIALGIRADEVTLGLVLAVLVLLIKSETALVHVARAESGQPPPADRADVAAPRGGLPARSRGTRCASIPFYRAFVAMEFTLLALVAELLDEVDTLLVVLVPVAAVTALGHLVAILTSDRLR